LEAHPSSGSAHRPTLRPVPSGRGGDHDGDDRDRRTFEEFYLARYGQLAAQIHAYVGNRAEAEDVVQEAFVRTWQRWSDVCAYDDPASWVRRVAWNLATSRFRRLAVAGRALRRHGTVQVVPALSPDHVALVAALRRLPDRQRHAIVLHYIADVPVLEIAEDLGVPKGTVLSWLHRARTQLAMYLSDDGGAGPALEQNLEGR
jgi:RNA polymerase sigma-70 factor (ECF subfamily)